MSSSHPTDKLSPKRLLLLTFLLLALAIPVRTVSLHRLLVDYP